MEISVFGLGYVGLATSLYFAEMGHCVAAVDIDVNRISRLKKGNSPFFEQGLEDLLKKNIKENRIQFFSDFSEMPESSLVFICLGTPQGERGLPQTTAVVELVERLIETWKGPKYLIIKSTVPVGYCDDLQQLVSKKLQELNKTFLVHVISNPEFLREGWSIQDTFHPTRVIAGTQNAESEELMRKLYSSVSCPILFMSPRSSEMTKYAANALLATKISAMNELARLSEVLGCDIEKIRQGVALDPRIGEQFLMPGVGFGGPCLPKDLQAFIAQGERANIDLPIMKSVALINDTQKSRFLEKMVTSLAEFKGKTIAIWGASFKAGVEDIRESSVIYFLPELIKLGATVCLYDPLASEEVKRYFANHLKSGQLTVCQDQYEAIDGVDALLVLTEWDGFAQADLKKVQNLLKGHHLFDARNIFHPKAAHLAGLEYCGIGRSGDGL